MEPHWQARACTPKCVSARIRGLLHRRIKDWLRKKNKNVVYLRRRRQEIYQKKKAFNKGVCYWRCLKRGLVVGSGWLLHVALNLDVCLPVAGLGNLIGGLHAKKSIHLRAESLLDPQRHVRRERGAAVEKGRKSGPGHAKNLGGLGNGEIKRLGYLHSNGGSLFNRRSRCD